MFFERTVHPRLSDCDPTGHLSCKALLNILEDVGSQHSEALHDDIIGRSRQGSSWVLVSWRVQFSRRPDGADLLHVTTWSRANLAKGAMFRDFLVTDPAGQELARAEARLAMVDLATGRLVRVTEEMYAAYATEERTLFDTKAPRLRPPQTYETERAIPLRRSDIDFNGHVHNSRYLELALEAVPEALYRQPDFRELHVLYRRPLREGDEVWVRCHTDTEAGVCQAAIYSGGLDYTIVEWRR